MISNIQILPPAIMNNAPCHASWRIFLKQSIEKQTGYEYVTIIKIMGMNMMNFKRMYWISVFSETH